uniref:hypothetical protein n=1 Tax=Agathobacter sp. TaxID=2021311 RepID=UPI004056E112
MEHREEKVMVKPKKLGQKSLGKIYKVCDLKEDMTKHYEVLDLKETLVRYYEAPEPKRKQAFIRQMGVQDINLLRLAGMQAKYISKWVWIVSGLFCGLTYGIAHMMQETMEEKYISWIAAMLPFLVMLSITESVRSYRCGMEELELSARFSLKSIVMARLFILGVGNLTVLVFVSLLLGAKAEFHMLYLLTPYFVTAGGGLFIVRNMRANENTFFCFLLAAAVSTAQMVLPWQFSELFLPGFLPLWAMVCIMGIAATIKESYRTIQMTEDLAWN